MMRVIIAGSRSIFDYDALVKIIEDSGFEITSVVSGMASGVDRLGQRWARDHNIPIKQFPADWSLGRGAGFKRNTVMAKNADALILLWNGYSSGSRHMLEEAERKRLKVFSRILTFTEV